MMFATTRVLAKSLQTWNTRLNESFSIAGKMVGL